MVWNHRAGLCGCFPSDHVDFRLTASTLASSAPSGCVDDSIPFCTSFVTAAPSVESFGRSIRHRYFVDSILDQRNHDFFGQHSSATTWIDMALCGTLDMAIFCIFTKLVFEKILFYDRPDS